MSNHTLIFGKGYVGSRIKEELGFPMVEPFIRTYADAEKIILEHKPKVLINAVGFTGRNVDECESFKDETLLANTFVPLMLAEACLRHGVKLVHISSGCIFHYDYRKDQPITEDVIPGYLELFYSRSKIYTEAALAALTPKLPMMVLRIRVPLDNRPSSKDLLSKLITYKKVIDAPNSVTYIPDFIQALAHLLKIDATGTFNMVCKDPLYYPDLLAEYKKVIPSFEYEVIPVGSLKMARTNLVLSTAKLEATGFPVRSVKEIIPECVREYAKSGK